MDFFANLQQKLQQMRQQLMGTEPTEPAPDPTEPEPAELPEGAPSVEEQPECLRQEEVETLSSDYGGGLTRRSVNVKLLSRSTRDSVDYARHEEAAVYNYEPASSSSVPREEQPEEPLRQSETGVQVILQRLRSTAGLLQESQPSTQDSAQEGAQEYLAEDLTEESGDSRGMPLKYYLAGHGSATGGASGWNAKPAWDEQLRKLATATKKPAPVLPPPKPGKADLWGPDLRDSGAVESGVPRVDVDLVKKLPTPARSPEPELLESISAAETAELIEATLANTITLANSASASASSSSSSCSNCAAATRSTSSNSRRARILSAAAAAANPDADSTLPEERTHSGERVMPQHESLSLNASTGQLSATAQLQARKHNNRVRSRRNSQLDNAVREADRAIRNMEQYREIFTWGNAVLNTL